MTKCRALGCARETTPFGAYCSTHTSRRRKNGHEDQRSIKAMELRPYLEIIEARRHKNPGNPTWAALAQRWERLAEEATGVLGAYEAGKPTLDHKRAAAVEVVRLAATTEPQTVIDTVLAMTVYWRLVPRVFMSDEAFKVQVVRRVIRLSPNNVQSYVGPVRPKRAYRELSPRVMEVLSYWLLSAFGAAGVKMAELEGKDREEADRISKDLSRGLEDLQ